MHDVLGLVANVRAGGCGRLGKSELTGGVGVSAGGRERGAGAGLLGSGWLER